MNRYFRYLWAKKLNLVIALTLISLSTAAGLWLKAAPHFLGLPEAVTGIAFIAGLITLTFVVFAADIDAVFPKEGTPVPSVKEDD